MQYFCWGCRGNLTLITFRSERVNSCCCHTRKLPNWTTEPSRGTRKYTSSFLISFSPAGQKRERTQGVLVQWLPPTHPTAKLNCGKFVQENWLWLGRLRRHAVDLQKGKDCCPWVYHLDCHHPHHNHHHHLHCYRHHHLHITMPKHNLVIIINMIIVIAIDLSSVVRITAYEHLSNHLHSRRRRRRRRHARNRYRRLRQHLSTFSVAYFFQPIVLNEVIVKHKESNSKSATPRADVPWRVPKRRIWTFLLLLFSGDDMVFHISHIDRTYSFKTESKTERWASRACLVAEWLRGVRNTRLTDMWKPECTARGAHTCPAFSD